MKEAELAQHLKTAFPSACSPPSYPRGLTAADAFTSATTVFTRPTAASCVDAVVNKRIMQFRLAFRHHDAVSNTDYAPRKQRVGRVAAVLSFPIYV